MERGYFSDVEVAHGVDPDAVRGIGELSGGFTILAPAREEFASNAEYADPAVGFRNIHDIV